MVSPLIHPKLLESLYNFYPTHCTIQQDTGTTQNSYGAPVAAWANLAGHIDLDCYRAATGGLEVQQFDMTVVTADYAIELAGYYSTITTGMRAVIGAATYDILSVIHDSQAQTTKLLVKVVST